MSLKDNFIQHLQKQFPQISPSALNNLISENLISPHRLQLSKTLFQKLQNQVSEIYQLRTWSEQNLKSKFVQQHQLPIAENLSVCTSFDFHINPEDQPKLIEINTNASFLALGLSLYDFWEIKNITDFNYEKLVAMFKHESELVGQKKFNLAIMDENPPEQRLFAEFLIYQQLLEAEIVDIHEVKKLKPQTLIYNRYTDFYLENEKSKLVKELYQQNQFFLSPSPWEYFLLADKQRLNDWQKQTEYPVPSSLLKSYDLAQADRDFIWNERKHLFFKPKSSYGSKQAYKGASISKKVFDEVFDDGFIAQEYAAASEIEVMQDGEKKDMRYDLRCYTYQDEIQLVIARLYQGQTTNLKTVGGGFAIVEFN